MIGIYKITSPTNRVYIGQSVNIEKRWKDYNLLKNCKPQIKLYRSLIKYGIINHKFEIIEECSIEQLNERERYWQDYYNVLGLMGLNCILQKTGDKSGKDSIERINNRSNKNKKKIIQYDLEGNFIQEWSSIIEIIKTLNINNITTVLKGKQKQAGGFIWRYKNTKEIPLKIEVNLKSDLKRTIVQYTKDKQFIKEWDYIKQAQDELGIGDLNSCLTGKTKTAGGFIWKYKEEQNKIEEINLDHKFNKPVLQLDLQGNIINKFKSKQEAEQQTGIPSLYYNLKSGNNRDGFIYKYDK